MPSETLFPERFFMKTKPFSQAALSLAVALALSACAAPKANPNLTLEATGQVMSAAETAERYDVNGNWWEIYQSPQLNALMEQALANNVDLKQAASASTRLCTKPIFWARIWCLRSAVRWARMLLKT